MKLIAAAPKICAYLKKTFVFLLSISAQTTVSSLQTSQPLTKPRNRLKPRP